MLKARKVAQKETFDFGPSILKKPKGAENAWGRYTMAFSLHTYDEHRNAQRLIREQQNREKMEKINAEMDRLDSIKEQHETLVNQRQARRLSELSPRRTSIAGYSSFDVAGGSSFGTATRTVSPKTPVVAQVRRKTVSIQELEKLQTLTGNTSPQQFHKKEKRRYSAVSSPSSKHPTGSPSFGGSLATVTEDATKKTAARRASRSARRSSAGPVKAAPMKTAFVRRASSVRKMGTRRATFALSGKQEKRRPSSARVSRARDRGVYEEPKGTKPTASFTTPSSTSARTSDKKRRSTALGIEHVERLRQHAASKSASYMEKQSLKKPVFQMTKIERMEVSLKESYELIDQLSEQLMPFLKGKPLPGGDVDRDSSTARKTPTSGEIPSYRLVEIRTLRKRAQGLEAELHEREGMIEHWRQKCEKAEDVIENLTEHKSGEIEAAVEVSDQQNKELVRMLDEMNDRLEEKEHVIQALESQAKSVSALMKEIKRLEKIAGRKMELENDHMKAEELAMKNAELETKHHALQLSNVKLEETMEKWKAEHGSIEDQRKQIAEEKQSIEASKTEAEGTAKAVIQNAQNDAEALRKEAAESAAVTKKEAEDWVKTSKSRQEEWINDSTKEHEAVIRIAKDQHETWSADTKSKINESMTVEMSKRIQAHEKYIEREQKLHAEKLKKLQEEHEKRIALEYEDHTMKIMQNEDSAQKRIEESVVKHREFIEESLKNHNETLNTQADAHAGALSEVTEEHAKSLDEEKAQFYAEIERAKEAHIRALEEASEEKQKELHSQILDKLEENENLIKKAKGDTAKELLALRQAAEEEIAREREKWKSELEGSREVHAAWIQRETHSHTAALQEESDKHKEALSEDFEAERLKLKLEIEATKKEHEEWVEQRTAEHNLWVEGARNTVEQNLLVRQNVHNDKLQEERKLHIRELNIEKEEHRKLLESIQIMTYKNLELERTRQRESFVPQSSAIREPASGNAGGQLSLSSFASGVSVQNEKKGDDYQTSPISTSTQISALERLSKRYTPKRPAQATQLPPAPPPSPPPPLAQIDITSSPDMETRQVGSPGRSPFKSYQGEDALVDSLELDIDTENGGRETLIIRRSDNVHEVVHRFSSKYGISDNQVQTIIDYVVSRFH